MTNWAILEKVYIFFLYLFRKMEFYLEKTKLLKKKQKNLKFLCYKPKDTMILLCKNQSTNIQSDIFCSYLFEGRD